MAPTVIWQLTRACDLDCRDCPTAAEHTRRGIEELSTFEAYKTIDQIAALRPAGLIISGGDPLARPDLVQLVEYAKRRNLQPTVAVSPTRKLTAENIDALRRIGLTRLLFNVNGSSQQRHDTLHNTPGSFAATIRAMRWARDAAMRIEINTLLTRAAMTDLRALAQVLQPFNIEAWNVYFLVPIAASRNLEMLTTDDAERVFETLAGIAATARFPLRAFEAPHFRRFLLQHQADAVADESWADFAGYVSGKDPVAAAIDDVVFISSNGEVRPSEFLPLSGGNVRYRSLASIYRASDLFVALRDRSNLKGRCARCEYGRVCGGSRARAWAVTGDLFASDPLCAYQPQAMEKSA